MFIPMVNVNFLRIIFIVFWWFAGTGITLGQVKYAFGRDTIPVKGGQTFSNYLKVTNAADQRVILRQDVQHTLSRGLLNLPDSLVLEAGQSRSFPLKYMGDRQTMNSNAEVFTVRLVSIHPGVRVQESARFTAQLTDAGGLTIGTEDDEVYLSQLSNQAQVVVRCANNGFVPLSFRLLLTGIPDGLEFTGQTMNLTLLPGAQQLLPFVARNKEGSRAAADFTVTIQAVDESNHQLAVKILRIVRVTSARRLGAGIDQLGGALPNSVSLRFGSLSNSSYFYQLQANGHIKTGGGQQLEYRLNADQYHQPGNDGVSIYNTYLDYQAKKWGLKVGNIYENIDFPLSGRGIKASAKLSDRKTLSVYGIQNNFQLYDQVNRPSPGAKIAALDYIAVDPGKQEQRITYLYSHDPYTGINASQLSMKTGYKWADGQLLSLEGGYSLEDIRTDLRSAEQGWSAALNYAMNSSAYQFNGSAYYSSPYFTGLRRGLLHTDVRVLRKLGDFRNISAHISVQVTDPKYQDSISTLYTRGINKNAIYQYEAAYNTRAGNFYLGFSPYFLQQYLRTADMVSGELVSSSWKSASVRFAANLGYNGRLHSFSVNADYGYTYLNSSHKPPAPFHTIKISSSYTMPVLGFSSYIQLNPYYLSDALSTTGTNSYRLYSLGPNVHFTAMDNALSVQLSSMYNYYGFTNSNNYSLTGNIRYLMKGHWSLTGDLMYMVSRQNSALPVYDPALTAGQLAASLYNHNRQLRLGLEKQFGRTSANSKKLALTYYEDLNGNGVRDANEQPAEGLLVKINGEAALTNSKGMVEFRDMKKEAYTVAVTNTKGWSLSEPTTVFLDKNKTLEIPLVKTQALNGCLKLVESKYMDKMPALAGIRINAADQHGRIHYTLTDEEGKFCFYLPRNEYTVYIETTGLPFSIENGKEQVSLHGAPVGLLTFLYRDESRKVGVTRF